jgi:hypothetical protein
MRRPCAAVALALVAAAPAVRAEIVSDAWYVSTLGGRPLGYAHEVVEVGEDGVILTTTETRLTMRRGPETVSVGATERWTENAAARPMEYAATIRMASEVTVITAVAGGGRLRFAKRIGDDETARAVEAPPDLLFPEGVARLHAAQGFAEGSAYGYTIFDQEFEDLGACEVRVVGLDSLELLGEERLLHRLVVVNELYDGVEVLEWRDDDGRLWREETPALGLVRERTTRELATQTREPDDIIATTLVRSNVVLADPHAVDAALYEIWLDGTDAAPRVVEDARQSIEGETERGVRLRVERTEPARGAAEALGTGTLGMDEALAEFLEPSPVLPSDDPEFVTLAASIVAEEEDAWAAAVAIERWVRAAVEDKGFGTAFASAREVLEEGAGDCSEHAVLMAALARAAGIPSRIAAGLVYWQGAFAYHMWVEVWTGDGWYALDPTVGKGSVDATHVTFASSPVSGGNVAELSLAVMQLVNRVRVELIEYTIDGKVFRAAGH